MLFLFVQIMKLSDHLKARFPTIFFLSNGKNNSLGIMENVHFFMENHEKPMAFIYSICMGTLKMAQFTLYS